MNTDELKAKRANVERIKEFSKNLKQFNKEMITQQPPPPEPEKEPSKRDKALAFAENIPKPKVKKPAEEKSESPIYDKGVVYSKADEQERHINELEQKHLQSKRQVEAIKKSLGL